MMLFTAVLLVGLLSAAAGESSPDQVTLGALSSKAHGVSGLLKAAGNSTLIVENFHYDGLGPDTFFWVGTEAATTPSTTTNFANTALLAKPFKDQHHTYQSNSIAILEKSEGENAVLTLPPHMKVADVKWLSVWCRKFKEDFGNWNGASWLAGGTFNLILASLLVLGM